MRAEPVRAAPDVLSSAMEVLAQQAASMLALLALEARDLCRARGVQQVLYMTREGLVFQAVHQAMADQGVALPAGRLLHVSRLATFAASLRDDGPHGLTRLFSQYPDAGWPEVARSLAADVPSASPQRGLALLEELRREPRLQAWLQGVVEAHHGALQTYLRLHHGTLLECARAVVVDVGWRGTIQDNLARAFPQVHWSGLYLGLWPPLNTPPSNADKRGLLFDPQRPIAGHEVLAIEYLMLPRESTVRGYAGGQPVPLGPPAPEDRFRAAFQARLQALAAERARALLAAGDEAALRARWRAEAVGFWHGAQQMPPELFAALRAYTHEETFGLGRSLQLQQVTSPRAFWRSLFSARERALFVQHVASLPLALRHRRETGLWLRAWLLLRWGLARWRGRRGRANGRGGVA